MSGISDTATVTLNVNGAPAKKEMEELRQKIEATANRITELKAKIKDKDAFNAAKDAVARYSSEIDTLKARLKEAAERYRELKDSGASKDALRDARKSMRDLSDEIRRTNSNLKAAKAELTDFDPKTLEKAKRELKGYHTSLERIQAVTVGVNNALHNLDKASPKELEKTLRALNKEFKNARQGSVEYEALAVKIRAVKEQLSEVRDELNESQSLWGRFKQWATSAWPAIDLISKGFDAIVSKMREYVDAFSGMDQEMASVRKFTGMTEKEVDILNQEFKRMDTRSSREQLNQLAQEAGRLGKQSVEDVTGFVRAADQINVALDDLGKGATLTLSKLTGTFGVEEIYGTEQSLLKVGSVINELSQNCSASAPYITDFTQRMAGVGVQANMSIPQIMGFAAVLDTNSQAVEASATAVSQVLVRLYQDPAKYAEVAGLDVKNFTKLLKEDANSAFILFLDTLNKAGGMDVLSPMFKDMGETGSRAISALTTLAKNIDAVKSQQEVANEAFREGTSIGAEFNVQNNTVEAGLEKVKNAAHEYQVELGEKLYPLVGHILSSTSAVMKALMVVISYIYEHKASMMALVAAIGAYNIAINIAILRQKTFAAAAAIGKAATVAWTVTVKLCSAAVALLSLNLTKAKAAWQALSLVLKASPVGLAAAALAFLVSRIVMAISRTDEFRKSMDGAMKSATSFSEETRKEIRELDDLFGKLEGARKGTEEYDKAKKSIVSRYGIYLQGLIDERGEITNLEMAYNRLTWAARKSAQARGINAAKESLDSTFFKEVDEMTEKIGSALRSEGMDDRQVSRLVSSISQAMAGGSDVSMADRKEIAAFEESHLSPWSGFFGGKSALALVHELRGKQQGYKRRSEKLESMDTRYFSSMDADELSRQIDSLTEALAKAPQNEVSVNISVKDDATAGRIKDIVGSSPGASSQAGPNPLLSPRRETKTDSLLYPGKGATATPLLSGVAGTVPESLVLTADLHGSGGKSLKGVLSREQAESLVRELMYERDQRGLVPENPSGFGDSGSGYTSGSAAGGASSDRFAKEKEWREKSEAEARISYARGIDTYSEYTLKMKEIAEEYYNMLLERDDLSGQERLGIQADYWESVNQLFVTGNEALVSQEDKNHAAILDHIRKTYRERLEMDNLSADERKAAEREYAEAVELAELEHLATLVKYTKEGSEERLEAQRKLHEAELEAAKRHRKEMEDLEREAKEKAEKERRDAEDKETERQRRYDELKGDPDPKSAKVIIQKAIADYEKEVLKLKNALSDGIIDEKEFGIRLERLKNDLFEGLLTPLINAKSEWISLSALMIDSWKDFADAIKDPDGDPFGRLAKAIGATAALMSSVMSQMSAMTQAELTIQTAKIEKRYGKEIEMAEGNSYKIAKLEKKRDAEISKVKSDANRKMFAMQVIQAVAQTAQNAVEGFGVGLQAGFPMAMWLAPALAAMAAAQGAVQIAVIKKQQQASEAQGYSRGGYTRPGAVDEPAGIVHAGEWVASQKLLASPVARPMIEALDYAQRTNTIGSLRSEDVSRSITAGQSISMLADSSTSGALIAAALASNAGVVDRLTRRLDEPFVTVNTVTGPTGIKQAQDEYDMLMRNKSPKSRKLRRNAVFN